MTYRILERKIKRLRDKIVELTILLVIVNKGKLGGSGIKTPTKRESNSEKKRVT